MIASRRRHCRGQSMTEFLVALAVLVPLFLAVTYAGRYGDIMQSTVQASRYAAFQRARQPVAQLSDATLEDQMRARFFVRGDFAHAGKIQSDDTARNLRGDIVPPVWRDLSMRPLMTNPQSARLTMGSTTLNSGIAERGLSFMAISAGKTYGNALTAQVEVGLVNKLDLSDHAQRIWSVGATTAAAGDNLSSSGSQATRDAAATIVPSAMVPAAVSTFLNLAMQLFEPSGPEFGCIKPDVVANTGPTTRLQGFAPAGGCR